MLFAVNYTNQSHRDEALDKRIVKLLAAWKPPAGFEMKSWYDYADGSGGIAIVDVPSAEVLLEAVGPGRRFLRSRSSHWCQSKPPRRSSRRESPGATP